MFLVVNDDTGVLNNTVWSIPYIVSVSFLSKFKTEFIAYRSSNVSSRPDCIFENHQLWQSGFSRVYSNACCRCSFEPEIIKISLSSHKMYSNKILKFQESTTILNACIKKNLETYHMLLVYVYVCVPVREDSFFHEVFIHLKGFCFFGFLFFEPKWGLCSCVSPWVCAVCRQKIAIRPYLFQVKQ